MYSPSLSSGLAGGSGIDLRPDLVAGGIAAPGLHSFPSGHAVLTVAVYGLVAYLWARASCSWLERFFAIGICIVWTALVGPPALHSGRTGPAMYSWVT